MLRGLRGQIYAMARNEIQVAKVLWPGRTVHRPGRVHAEPEARPRVVSYMARAEASSAPAATAQAANTTQQKLILRAWVTLTPQPVTDW